MLFLSFLVPLIFWEVFYPARKGVAIFSARKIGNISLYPLIIFTGLYTKLVCVWLMTTYLWSTNIGLLSILLQNKILYVCLAFLVLDISMYLQHRVLHASSFLWGVHVLHHADTEVDITTYFRHHPFELVFGVTVTYLTILIFGITPLVLAGYLVVNNLFQLIQHSNIMLPAKLNRWLVHLVVTPAFHAKHHSIVRSEADSNYSTILTVWDRMFGTYNNKSNTLHSFGVEGFESERYQGIDKMLLMPFLTWWGKSKSR